MNTMTPSEEKATNGQFGKFTDCLRPAFQQAGFPKQATQDALEQQGEAMTKDVLAVIRKYVEMFCNIFVRIVKVNPELTPKQVIDATNRKQYVDSDVLKTMPRGEGNQVKLTFFQVGSSVSDDNLEKEFAKRGLKPADGYSLAAANQDDPALADTKPNATHWKDANGNWCYIAFRHWRGVERSVNVNRIDGGWHVDWWFVGVSK